MANYSGPFSIACNLSKLRMCFRFLKGGGGGREEKKKEVQEAGCEYGDLNYLEGGGRKIHTAGKQDRL